MQTDRFRSWRSAVDECAFRWVRYGALDYDEQAEIRADIGGMFDALKSEIRSIPPQDYVACRTFLRNLLYATTHTTL